MLYKELSKALFLAQVLCVYVPRVTLLHTFSKRFIVVKNDYGYFEH